MHFLLKNNKLIFILLCLFIASCNSSTKKLKTQQSLVEPSEVDFLKDYNSVNGAGLYTYNPQYKSIVAGALLNKDSNYIASKNDIFNLMQSPFLIKKDGSSELWQYRSSKCIISVAWDISNNNKANKIYAYDNNLHAIDYKICIKQYIQEKSKK